MDMGRIVQKDLVLDSGQTRIERDPGRPTKLIRKGGSDTTSTITHRSTALADGPGLDKTFRDKQDG